jgi:hypothetical protein
MIARTIEIPDWIIDDIPDFLLSGDFWCGYFSGAFSLAAIVTAGLLYWANNFNPFGR